MMDRLDRYVARVFLSSWVLAMVFFTGLHFVYKLFDRFDELIADYEGEGHGLGEAAL